MTASSAINAKRFQSIGHAGTAQLNAALTRLFLELLDVMAIRMTPFHQPTETCLGSMLSQA
jgi:hypothetical protein